MSHGGFAIVCCLPDRPKLILTDPASTSQNDCRCADIKLAIIASRASLGTGYYVLLSRANLYGVMLGADSGRGSFHPTPIIMIIYNKQ